MYKNIYFKLRCLHVSAIRVKIRDNCIQNFPKFSFGEVYHWIYGGQFSFTEAHEFCLQNSNANQSDVLLHVQVHYKQCQFENEHQIKVNILLIFLFLNKSIYCGY